MLKKEQILHLLARCEAIHGKRLQQIRGNLAGDQWLPFVWEMLIMEAFSRISNITYEPKVQGNTNLDFSIDIYNESKIYIEAVFRLSDTKDEIQQYFDHPAHKSLCGKIKQIEDSKINCPSIICIGTDRVQCFNNFHSPREISRDQAIRRFFQESNLVSGVIIVPILHDFKVFKGTTREARPMLYLNNKATYPLTKFEIDTIYMVNFNRWPYSIFTANAPALFNPGEVKRSLYPITPPTIASHLLPHEWTSNEPFYQFDWFFYNLKIIRVGDKKYALVCDNEIINQAESPEILAKMASYVFQVFPARIIGPRGPMENPEKGVSSDLSAWKLVLPHTS